MEEVPGLKKKKSQKEKAIGPSEFMALCFMTGTQVIGASYV